MCVKKVLCVLRNRFFTFSTIRSIESIASVQKNEIEILMDLHVLRATESKKVSFGMSSVCVCVCLCLSVCGHDNSKNNWASSTKFGMKSYMIKFSAGIAWAESAHGCGLCPDSTIRFFGEKCLKNALYNNFFQTKVVTNHNTQLLVEIFFDRSTGLASALTAKFGFLAKSALKMRCTKILFYRKMLLQMKSHIFYVM